MIRSGEIGHVLLQSGLPEGDGCRPQLVKPVMGPRAQMPQTVQSLVLDVHNGSVAVASRLPRKRALPVGKPSLSSAAENGDLRDGPRVLKRGARGAPEAREFRRH